MMLLWQLATIRWRAGCAERCTSGSERRDWEIVLLRPVSYSTFELFHTNNDLYIINYLNDSLLCYSIDGKFVKGLPIKFHKEMFLPATDSQELTFLIDPISQNAYLLERYMTRWVLSQINLATGKKGTTIPLPDYSGMDGIYVYDNAVYFTYHEKLHPYYTRLYRYQL